MRVYYHNDLDGHCSAAIIYKANASKKGEYLEMDYKDQINLDLIIKREGIIIVDFSFPQEIMLKILERTPNVTWIDHHKTILDHPSNIPLISGIRNTEFSGCELTWMYYFPTLPMPQTVWLIGDYDKWSLQHQPDCFDFYEGMKLQNTQPTSKLWEDLLIMDSLATTEKINQIILNGRIAIQYRNNYCAKLCKSYGYEITFMGYKAYAINFYMFGSKGFGDKFDQYDICIAYIHDGKRFTVSLYSEKINVSEIAKKYGGGGHVGAAGFVVDELPFLRNRNKDLL